MDYPYYFIKKQKNVIEDVIYDNCQIICNLLKHKLTKAFCNTSQSNNDKYFKKKNACNFI